MPFRSIRLALATLAGAALLTAGTSLPAAAADNAAAADKASVPHDLGTLIPGGSSSAMAINRFDDVVGYADTAPGYHFHAVLWSHGKITDLGALDPAWNSTASAINDRGIAVGWSNLESSGGSVAVIFKDGKVIPIGYGGSTARAINNRGQIAGGNGNQAVIWNEKGEARMLPSPANCQYYTEAEAINDRGEAVGGCSTFQDGWHSIRWDAKGNPTDLGPILVHSINNRGQIAGENLPTGHAILITNGVTRDLGVLPNGTASQANGVNDSGVVVGNASVNYNQSGFRWAHGTMKALGDLAPYSASIAQAINNRGHIAGTSNMHAVLWK
jgi:probable HAF family extracellular repeat protein